MHKLRALRASFEEGLDYLQGATASLGLGQLPTKAAALRLHELQEQFVQVRESLIDEAAMHGVSVPEKLTNLDALEALGQAIATKRRGELHDQVGSLLSRTASLCHQEEVVFQSLQQIREEAIALSGEDAPIEELERLVDGSHPFVHLLRLVEGGESLSHDEALQLSQITEETFGRALAVAVLRKRLLLGPQETPSSHSLPSLLLQGGAPLSPSGVYEGALELERRANANLPPFAHLEKEQGRSKPSESSVSLDGANGAALPPHAGPSRPSSQGAPKTDPHSAPTSSRPQPPLRTTDTWDELPSSVSHDARSAPPPGKGAPASSSPSVPPPPFVLASETASVFKFGFEPPTDEVAVIDEMPGSIGTNEEEPTSEDDGFQLHIPNDFGAIEVPSIEMLAVAAMNDVLLPGGASKEDLDRFPEHSETTPPRPPSTPRKIPTPTFLTPLPLSVTMAPGGVLQPNKQHELAVAAAQEAGSRESQRFGSFHDSLDHIPSGHSSSSLISTSSSSLSSLSSPSMPLDSYDAMLIRKVDPHDPSRSSPLTIWQEAELQRQEHGVAVLFGSSALGLEDLSDFVEMSVGAEQLYVIDQVYAPHRFLRQIRQIAGRRDGHMTFVLVTQQTPWDSSWVRGALELVGQMKASGRPLRITFVADPPSTWSMIPSIQPLQQDGAMMLSLQPWHDSALLKWLQQLDFPFDHKIRRSIRRVTGNWSFALKFFCRQMKQSPNQWARHLGSLKQVLESRELAQKALRIMGLTHKTTLSILHKLTLEEPATQESMERAFAHAPPRLITRALLWAERLSLAQYENYFWTTNPLVARLLKALR